VTVALDTDRIALSAELSCIAERFAIEASLWALPDARRECERVAGYLATLSRNVLTGGDVDIVSAYAEASRLLIDNVVGVRRFFQTITTQPRVRGRRVQYASLDCRDGQHDACATCGCRCHQ